MNSMLKVSPCLSISDKVLFVHIFVHLERFQVCVKVLSLSFQDRQWTKPKILFLVSYSSRIIENSNSIKFGFTFDKIKIKVSKTQDPEPSTKDSKLFGFWLYTETYIFLLCIESEQMTHGVLTIAFMWVFQNCETPQLHMCGSILIKMQVCVVCSFSLPLGTK